MAHKKAGGSTKLGRDSESKRLGIKIFGNQRCRKGNIIVRQRGTRYYPGQNVIRGKDYTIMAKIDGLVQFRKKRIRKFHGNLKEKTIVNVLPLNKEANKVKK